MANNLIITKDNQLVSASYELSLIEQRIILLCIAKLDSRKNHNGSFIISVDDMHDYLGMDKDNAYRDLKRACKRLYERSILIDPSKPDNETRWIYDKVTFPSVREAQITFTPKIMPFLTELKEKFTSYKLKDVAHFKSSYSFRFYEIFAQWKCKSEISVSVEWIRELMQLQDKYPRIVDLKKYVIDPSVEDINKFSNLDVSYEQVKNGREITHLLFKYKPKGGVKEGQVITRKYIEKHAIPGESWDEARDRLRKLKRDTNLS